MRGTRDRLNAPALVEAQIPVATVAVRVRCTLHNEIVRGVDSAPRRIVVLDRAWLARVRARRARWPHGAWRDRGAPS